jgi:hypothetical protein
MPGQIVQQGLIQGIAEFTNSVVIFRFVVGYPEDEGLTRRGHWKHIYANDIALDRIGRHRAGAVIDRVLK